MSNSAKTVSVAVIETDMTEVRQQLDNFVDNEQVQAMTAFNTMLDNNPPGKWVKKNDGLNYLPIRIVESLLRSIFGAYQIEMIGEPKILGNSVVISVHLKVYHPVLQQWLTYAGTGAVPIQLKRGTESAIDFQAINKMAMMKNVPAAKAYAVSNAAKSLGRLFGSQLNNDLTEHVPPLKNVY